MEQRNNIVGSNVNAYLYKKTNLSDLILKVGKNEKLKNWYTTYTPKI